MAALTPGDWTSLGPGNIGGRIRSIVIDPNNGNNMWVGSVGGGIWHSTDAGASWQVVDDFMANLAIASMVIDPVNPSNMYAGTGEGFGNYDALQGNGIFKSTNGGLNWAQLPATSISSPAPPVCGFIGTTPCPAFWSFVNRLAISLDGTKILAATNGGIARSTDGGATWTQRANTKVTQDIDFRPDNNSEAVAGEIGGARYSIDGGQTWTAAAFNPPLVVPGPGTSSVRVELAYAPSNPLYVYASVDQNQGDIYESSNAGQTYRQNKYGITCQHYSTGWPGILWQYHLGQSI